MKKLFKTSILVFILSLVIIPIKASSSSQKSHVKSHATTNSSSFNIRSLITKGGEFWHLKSESNLLQTLKDLGFSSVENVYNEAGEAVMEDENGNKIIPKINGTEGIINPQYSIKHLQKDAINVYLIYFFSDLYSIEIVFPKEVDLKTFIKSATALHFRKVDDSYFLNPLSLTISGLRTLSISEDENPY